MEIWEGIAPEEAEISVGGDPVFTIAPEVGELSLFVVGLVGLVGLDRVDEVGDCGEGSGSDGRAERGSRGERSQGDTGRAAVKGYWIGKVARQGGGNIA